MKKNVLIALACIGWVVTLVSCRHDDSDPLPAPSGPGPSDPVVLQVTSFTPAGAAKDSTVTITGTGFSKPTVENKVLFNGKEAFVVTATPTALTVRVPFGAGNGKITVHTGSQEVTTADDFQYLYTVSTLAGSGVAGFFEGAPNLAKFHHPYGVATDAAGNNIYVADDLNNRIRKITPTGIVSTLAGDGTPGYSNGLGIMARFASPFGVATDLFGNIFVADSYNNRIRRIFPSGGTTVFAGDGTPGFAEGIGTAAQFNEPYALAVDAEGSVYVSDAANNRIRKILSTGQVSTLAGTGVAGFANGPGATAMFDYPVGIAVDAGGNVYVADANNHRIRKITQAAGGAVTVSTLAGDGTKSFADGPAATARFNTPQGLAIDAAGNLYVGDILNNRIRRITPSGVVSTIAGSAAGGFVNGVGTAASFFDPIGIAVDAHGRIYVADYGNNVIRKLE